MEPIFGLLDFVKNLGFAMNFGRDFAKIIDSHILPLYDWLNQKSESNLFKFQIQTGFQLVLLLQPVLICKLYLHFFSQVLLVL